MKSKTHGYIFLLLALTIFSAQDAISKHLGSIYSPIFVTMVRYWAFGLFTVVLAARMRGGIGATARTKFPPRRRRASRQESGETPYGRTGRSEDSPCSLLAGCVGEAVAPAERLGGGPDRLRDRTPIYRAFEMPTDSGRKTVSVGRPRHTHGCGLPC